jgi:nucleoside-diphosphate-sugar epimerase
MKIVVVGATGTIRKAIATLLNDKGYKIIWVSRHSQPGKNVNNPDSITAFYKVIGEVAAVISASTGTVSYATMSDLTDEGIDWDLRITLAGRHNGRRGLFYGAGEQYHWSAYLGRRV